MSVARFCSVGAAAICENWPPTAVRPPASRLCCVLAWSTTSVRAWDQRSPSWRRGLLGDGGGLALRLAEQVLAGARPAVSLRGLACSLAASAALGRRRRAGGSGLVYCGHEGASSRLGVVGRVRSDPGARGRTGRGVNVTRGCFRAIVRMGRRAPRGVLQSSVVVRERSGSARGPMPGDVSCPGRRSAGRRCRPSTWTLSPFRATPPPEPAVALRPVGGTCPEVVRRAAGDGLDDEDARPRGA